MANKELDDQIAAASKRLDAAHSFLHINDVEAKLIVLDNKIASPNFWDNAQAAQETTKQAGNLRQTLGEFKAAVQCLEDAKAAAELASEDASFEAEAKANLTKLDAALKQLEIASWFDGKFDQGACIVTISPGQGGLEAQDWTSMLYKMYSHYAQSKGWKVRALHIAPGNESVGLNRATFEVEGNLAYGMLQSEHGVHRLVRISPTDAKARRHTTFAAVEVLPVLPDSVEVDLNPADVRVDVFRSSGPGGQCVNTTDSAVRLTHSPSGIVVTCQNEKSQIHNKEAAFRVLKARLYELQQKKRDEEIDEIRGEKQDNSFGSQIRNYVLFPYQLVKDLRSGIETGNVDAVLSGEINEFVLGFHKWRKSQE